MGWYFSSSIWLKITPKPVSLPVDIAPASVEVAQARVRQQGLSNVSVRSAGICNLPFTLNSFDHIFLGFVLEHLQQPLAALNQLKGVLKPGETFTMIEGDHASAYFYPEVRRHSDSRRR